MAAGTFALPPASATAQDDAEYERACPWEQREEPACVEARAAQSATAYGLAPISDIEGEEYRIYLIDAWDQERHVIVFARPAGQTPELTVRFAVDPQFTLTQPISGEVWNRVERESALITCSVGPPPPRNDDRIVVCADGILAVVETRSSDGNIRRAAGHSCDRALGRPGVLAYNYAERLHLLAANTLIRCADLSREEFSAPWSLLDQCSLLEGDTVAASHALNLFARFELGGNDYALPERILARGAILTDHDGAIVEGRAAITAYWKTNFESVRPYRASGLNPETVQIRANIDLAESDGREGPDMWIDEAIIIFGRENYRPLVVTRIELGEPIELTEPDEDN